MTLDPFYYEDEGIDVVTYEDAIEFAEHTAREAIALIKSQKETSMNTEMKNLVDTVMTETDTSTKLVTGEILLDNIETLADKLVLSRLPWWKRITISKKNKELLVTVAVYAIVHAIRTGGFGMTKYRIDHSVISFITLAANQRILKAIVAATGVNTNVAALLFTAPEITTERGN